jgi:acetyl-CoA carboxylase biotin carboxyl carrier protein
MSKDQSSSADPFDLERIKQLIELMEQHNLREVKLKRGDQVWILRRGGGDTPLPIPTFVAQQPVAMPVPTASQQAPPAAKPAIDEGLAAIKSPTVGTFYSAPQPGDPPFVKVGDKVKHDSVVCLVEAMKFFNQVQAEVAGTITKILVHDGDPVEFGQPLFQVRPE